MAKNKKQRTETNACPLRKTSIGGQALMEGIMMRGPKMTAMAVRNPDGDIVIEKFPTESKPRPKILKLPIIRGVVGFIDSMTLGYKCLMRSAEISGLEELEAEMAVEKAVKKAVIEAKKAVKKGTATPEQIALVERNKKIVAENNAVKEAEKAVKKGKATDEQKALVADRKERGRALYAVEHGTATDEQKATIAALKAEDADAVQEAIAATESVAKPKDKKKAKDGKKKESSAMTDIMMVVSLIFSFAIMIGLFFWLPSFLYKDVMEAYIPGFPQNNRFLQSIFGAIIRLLILIGYMSLMLLMKDIRRTFQFHGAEHKTIFCYEHGLELTVENVRRERRFHPRCGTSFLIIMVLVGILIGFLIPANIGKWLLTLIKIAIVPLVMGIGYELIKICGRHDNFLTRIIAAPGLWFQRITVLEPDDAMIECAIAAMKEVIPEDGSDQI